MTRLNVRTFDGERQELSSSSLQMLRRDLRGHLISRDSPGYDAARQVWNGMIDKHPAMIVQCEGADDVVTAVNFAREHALLTSVRGGGHNVAGSALCNGGMVIDLSEMRDVQVDAAARTAHVAGGAQLGDVDEATQAYGLATPLGVVSRTGVAGLTLGGGYGWLTRRYGLTVDNLRAVEIVTADGELRRASSSEHPDLFWALRGGGGNFGVVTSFDYELHPVGPEVMLAATFYPVELAAEGLRFFREFMAEAPDELFGLGVLWSMPEGPPFPAEKAGDPVFVFVGVYSGDVAKGKRVVQPLRTFDDPLVDLSGPVSWLEAQTFYNEDYPDGMLYYWKSIYLGHLTDDAVDALLVRGIDRPSPLSNVDVWYLGGAMSRVDPETTPIWHRNEEIMIGVEANWIDPVHSKANIAWARDLISDLEPYSTGGSYVNFGGLGEESDNPPHRIYGGNYERLRRIKAKYDPENFFHVNHNIPPADVM